MDTAYQITEVCEVFAAAREQFEALIEALDGERTSEMEHGEVERLISRMGTEVLRLLMQAHLDLRARREVRREDLTGPDGSALSRCRPNRTRDLMTLFGEVIVRRKGYSAPGVQSLFPLDAALNLAKDKYSHELRSRVAEEVAGGSFDKTVATLEKTSGGKVPKRQTEEIAAAVAVDFESFYSCAALKQAEPTADILIMSVDQKGVVMLEDDLRPITRKAAEEAAGACSGARLAPGEKRNRKRMATVAAVYSIETWERTPEEIMGGKEEKSDRPRGYNKRVWASVEREPEAIVQEMFDEALRRDPEKKRRWAILLDGAEKQLDLVLTFILLHRLDVVLVLDFIHVLEYVWKAAFSFHAVGSKEAEAWVADQALRILRGEAERVALQMRERMLAHKLGKEKRKAVEKCADYLEKYAGLLDYPFYLKEGLPIASGVIEGACRHLVKDRMDVTGARWRLKGAEAVLRIRSLQSSGDFDAYWSYHLQKERERNYPSIPHRLTQQSVPHGQNGHEIQLQEAA